MVERVTRLRLAPDAGNGENGPSREGIAGSSTGPNDLPGIAVGRTCEDDALGENRIIVVNGLSIDAI